MGPLHTAAAVKEYEEGLAEIIKQGGKVLYGGYPTKERRWEGGEGGGRGEDEDRGNKLNY